MYNESEGEVEYIVVEARKFSHHCCFGARGGWFAHVPAVTLSGRWKFDQFG